MFCLPDRSTLFASAKTSRSPAGHPCPPRRRRQGPSLGVHTRGPSLVRIPRPLLPPSRRTSPPSNLVTSFRGGASERVMNLNSTRPAVSLAAGPAPRPCPHAPSCAARPSCRRASQRGRAPIQTSDPRRPERLDRPPPSVSCPPPLPTQSPWPSL